MSRRLGASLAAGTVLAVCLYAAASRGELIQPRPYDIVRTRSGSIEGRIVEDAPEKPLIWIRERSNNIVRQVKRSEIIEILQRQTPEQAYEEASRKASGNLETRLAIFQECLNKRLPALALSEARRMVSEAPDSPDARRAEIEALLHLGRKDEAVQVVRSVLALPLANDVKLLLAAGAALHAAGSRQEACEVFGKARKAAPKDPQPMTHEAQVLSDAGDLAAAQPLLEQALALDAGSYEALLAMGRLRLARGEYAEAFQYYTKSRPLASATFEGGRDVRPLVALGAIAYLEGRLEDAKPLLAEALNLRPNYRNAFYNLGLVLAAAGNVQEAYNYLTWANAPDGRMGRAHLARAHLVSNIGSPLEALEHARKAAEVSPDDAYCQYVAGFLEHRAGDPVRAADYFKKAFEAAPNSQEALLAQAALTLKQGYPEEAAKLYRQALDKWDSAGCRAGLGLALAASNRLEEAEEQLAAALEKAAPQSPERHDALVGLGYIANLKLMRDEAKRYFLLALGERGDSKYALDALGMLYEQEGKWIDFFGFEEAQAPAGWQVDAPYGVAVTFSGGRLVFDGAQARSDGGISSVGLTVTKGVFEAAAADVYVSAAAGGWEGGAFLQCGGLRIVVAAVGDGSLAWRYRDEKRGWREWTTISRFPQTGKVHVEFKVAMVPSGTQTVPGVVVYTDGREDGRVPAGRGLSMAGVRIGVYTSALIGKSVHMEADNFLAVAASGSAR